MNKLAGKVIVITGAAGGLGKAMAELFAREGGHIVIADIDAEAGERGAEAIRAAAGHAEAIAADISADNDVRRLVESIGARFTRVDVLVNNAGNLVRKDFGDLADADWASVLGTHVWGTVRVTRELLPLLRRAGEEDGAAVVNVASIMASTHVRQVSSYAASKAAIQGLSRSLAIEFAPFGIRVNTLCPGFVPTAMTRQYTRAPFSEALIKRIPMRRFGLPSEIAKAALFLACDDSAYMTGQELTVDGGMSINLL